MQAYTRFFRWAQGDGRLLALWPAYTYRRAPSLPELLGLLCCALLLALCSRWAKSARHSAAWHRLLFSDLLKLR